MLSAVLRCFEISLFEPVWTNRNLTWTPARKELDMLLSIEPSWRSRVSCEWSSSGYVLHRCRCCEYPFLSHFGVKWFAFGKFDFYMPRLRSRAGHTSACCFCLWAGDLMLCCFCRFAVSSGNIWGLWPLSMMIYPQPVARDGSLKRETKTLIKIWVSGQCHSEGYLQLKFNTLRGVWHPAMDWWWTIIVCWSQRIDLH